MGTPDTKSSSLAFYPNDRAHTWCDECGEKRDCIAFEYHDGYSWRGGYACEDCGHEMSEPPDEGVSR